MNKIDLFIEKMKAEKLPQIVIDNFTFYYNQLLKGETGLLPERDIKAIEELTNFDSLTAEYENFGKSVLDKSVLIKLNGGLDSHTK